MESVEISTHGRRNLNHGERHASACRYDAVANHADSRGRAIFCAGHLPTSSLGGYRFLALNGAASFSPPSQRTLRDVTVLIAANTKRTQLKPFSIAGTACLPAAAFLAMQDCLAADGVDVSNIAPSTPLHEYTRKNWQLFVHRIARLAPGAMPPIGISSGWTSQPGRPRVRSRWLTTNLLLLPGELARGEIRSHLENLSNSQPQPTLVPRSAAN